MNPETEALPASSAPSAPARETGEARAFGSHRWLARGDVRAASPSPPAGPAGSAGRDGEASLRRVSVPRRAGVAVRLQLSSKTGQNSHKMHARAGAGRCKLPGVALGKWATFYPVGGGQPHRAPTPSCLPCPRLLLLMSLRPPPVRTSGPARSGRPEQAARRPSCRQRNFSLRTTARGGSSHCAFGPEGVSGRGRGVLPNRG